jgi:hypothetical protein
VPPVILRARTVKKELEETKSLKHKLEAKEADIKVIVCFSTVCSLSCQEGKWETQINIQHDYSYLYYFQVTYWIMIVYLCKLGYD